MACQKNMSPAKAGVTALNYLSDRLFEIKLFSPVVASAARPGQFVILQATARSSRVSLPLAGISPEEQTISVVMSRSTAGAGSLAVLEVGGELNALMGPIGEPSAIQEGAASVLLVGDGAEAFGLAPVARALVAGGSRLSGLLAGDPTDARILAERLGCAGSCKTILGDAPPLEALARQIDHVAPALILAAGSTPLLRAVQQASKEKGVAARLRLNPPMLDGIGMCGGCRLKIGGRLAFCCLEGPEFEAAAVDFDYLERRERAGRVA
ncbi:MAG: hypothetical protein V2A77_08510 [Pseudomonadota bacterium]